MRDGRFWVRRITISKRMRAKLREVKDQLERRRYQPIPEQGRWLASVVRGHRAYYAVPGNRTVVASFRTQVTRHWHKALERRSQRTRISWQRMDRLATRWLPPARVMHPFPDKLLGAGIRDETARGGHYWAVRQFGPIGYEIVAISDIPPAPGPTPICYQSAAPDTWT